MDEVSKTIKAIDIVLHALEHDKDEWLKDLFHDIKATLQTQQQEMESLKVAKEVDGSRLELIKKRLEAAKEDMTIHPDPSGTNDYHEVKFDAKDIEWLIQSIQSRQ